MCLKELQVPVCITLIELISLEFVGIYAISKLYLVLVLHKVVTNNLTFIHIDTALQKNDIQG